MSDPTDRDREAARELWGKKGCYCDTSDNDPPCMICQLATALAQAREEGRAEGIEEAAGALRQYLRHDDACRVMGLGLRSVVVYDLPLEDQEAKLPEPDCGCGLAAAIRRLTEE